MSYPNAIIAPMKNGTYLRKLGGWATVNLNYGYWVAEKPIKPEEVGVGNHLGVWTDPETNITYYDKTHLITDLGTALILGRKWEQIAIWDNEEQKEIYLENYSY